MGGLRDISNPNLTRYPNTISSEGSPLPPKFSDAFIRSLTASGKYAPRRRHSGSRSAFTLQNLTHSDHRPPMEGTQFRKTQETESSNSYPSVAFAGIVSSHPQHNSLNIRVSRGIHSRRASRADRHRVGQALRMRSCGLLVMGRPSGTDSLLPGNLRFTRPECSSTQRYAPLGRLRWTSLR